MLVRSPLRKADTLKVLNSFGVKPSGNQRPMRRRGFLGGQAGQTAAEYLGVLLVVAAIIVAIGASGIAGTVSREIESAICSISGGPCESQADTQPDNGALAQIGEERTPQRAAEERQRQQSAAESILRDDVSRRQVVGDSSAVPAGEPGASIAEAQRALARERLTGRPLPPFLTEPQQQRALSNRLLARSLRALDPTPPTPFDQDGDGIEELRPPPAPEKGNAGDRFAGELCGLTQRASRSSRTARAVSGMTAPPDSSRAGSWGESLPSCCPRPEASSRRRSRASKPSATPNADGKASSTEQGRPSSDHRHCP
jgi:Flp pilus assembly pilin Flp